MANFLDSIHVGRPGVAFESKPLREDHSLSPPHASNGKTTPSLIEAVESPRMDTIITSSDLQQPPSNAQREDAREESSIVKRRERSLKWRPRCAISPPTTLKPQPECNQNPASIRQTQIAICTVQNAQASYIARIRMSGFENNYCFVIRSFMARCCCLISYGMAREVSGFRV